MIDLAIPGIVVPRGTSCERRQTGDFVIKASAEGSIDGATRSSSDRYDVIEYPHTHRPHLVRTAEAKLREIDDEVSQAALEALSETELAEFRQEAGRAIERHRGKVDEAALRDAMSRFTLQRARERFQLPRVSIV